MAQSFITGGYLYLTAKLSPGGTSFIGDRDLGITLGRLKMRDPNNPDSTYTEWIQFSTVTAVGDGTFTYGGLTRQLSQTADPATSLGTGNTWVAGTEAKLVAMHDQLADKLNGSLVTVYATTAARDAAIPSPTNGMSVYVTADGVFYDYQGGAWATRGNSATANASTTVAGKVEIATGAEVTAGTSTGGTGAILAVSPDQLVQEINGSTAKTTIVDADKLPLADSAASGVRKAITWANAKTQISTDMPASDTFAGLVERATDAEATTGTDTTRFITAKQAYDNAINKSIVYVYSYDLSTLSGTATVTHNLGKTAKTIIANCFKHTATDFAVCFGSYSSLGQKCTWSTNASGDVGTDSTHAIRMGSSAADYQVGTIQNITANSFDIAWTKTSSPTGLVYITFTIFA